MNDIRTDNSSKRILRVFPRRTSATPTDKLAFVGLPPLPFARPSRVEVDEVHVSVTFTWDIERSHSLVRAWSQHYTAVSIGGPALDDSGGEFFPGRYLADGHTITSRGCPNKCAGCFVPEREGDLRLLPIRDGHIVCDNNLLACGRHHIQGVLNMLRRQKDRAKFTGGLEAAMVDQWFVDRLVTMRLDTAHLAYDRPGQRTHVERAAKMIADTSGWVAGTLRRKIGCYVLVGFNGDTIGAAVDRLEWVKSLGIRPYPMFLRRAGENAKTPVAWSAAIRPYLRPMIAYSDAVTSEQPQTPSLSPQP